LLTCLPDVRGLNPFVGPVKWTGNKAETASYIPSLKYSIPDRVGGEEGEKSCMILIIITYLITDGKTLEAGYIYEHSVPLSFISGDA
jgi:hypothetical protein